MIQATRHALDIYIYIYQLGNQHVSRYPLGHTSGLSVSRWDRVVIIATTRALTLPRSRCCSIRHTQTTRYSSSVVVEDEDSRRLQHAVVDARYRGDNPPRVKGTPRVFPRPTYKASSACTEMLWCGKLFRVRSRAIAVVDYVATTLSKKLSVSSCFTIK